MFITPFSSSNRTFMELKFLNYARKKGVLKEF